MLYWDKLLTPKRFRETTSVEKSPNDSRSPFKKDFDTVCNSSVLRRLQDKAQVFPLEQQDYARTRLTHSIEVMSVASSLAVQATKTIVSKLGERDEQNRFKYISEACTYSIDEVKKTIEEIPTILNTAALLHDMGNPPFGHLGEQIISDWFSNNLSKLTKRNDGTYGYISSGVEDTLLYKLKGTYADDLMHFEGNAQLFRLVTKLCFNVDDNGLNLTFPVLASFIKYPCASSDINKSKLSTKKMGFFSSEKKRFDEICNELGLTRCRHPLAFLLEAADDIAYLSADIEDAHHKGIITVDSLVNHLAKKEYKDDTVVQKVIREIGLYKEKANQIDYPKKDAYVMHRTRVLIKGLMIDAMNDVFSNLYEDIMAGTCEQELIGSSNVSILAKALRDLEKDKIYYCTEIVESKTRAFAILNKLLDTYVPAVLNYCEDKDAYKDTAANLLYLSMSETYRYVCEQANKSGVNEETQVYNKLLLVTDQISGMTDSHAMTIYNRITAS